ncbi:hexokinase-1-like isoform X2 [Oppia nitens]|uniref:hexokinase-1-like isoform X2 n=1 Tax=Oppia nitens TaxID=1686743 RepID=UPI0023DCA1CA|nr:hexokinase-1-like isoform X2 [Oppia nitens]
MLIKNEIEEILKPLVLTNQQLGEIEALLLQSFNEGLRKDTNPVAPVKMFPTFVRDVPDGKEKYAEGKYMALDLGGTNFRVLLLELNGDKFHLDSEVYAVPEIIMHGTGEQLFDHIASCISDFMKQRKVIQYRIPLGFTFSFPCKQEGLTSARLTQWTKGFKCTGVEGEDVVQLLRDAIDKRPDIDVDVMAVVNDTTGTLMSCALKNRECRVGLIIGTGTNACYMETLENVELFSEDFPDVNQVVVNTELGAFGDNKVLNFIRTNWDEEVDTTSLNRGKQLFEKMISGMYLGETVRCILVDLCQKKLLFNGQPSDKLMTPKAFQTAYVSAVESDKEDDYNMTRQVMSAIDHRAATLLDCDVVKMVCKRVSTRAAHLVSAAVATILNKMKRPHTTIGVDGSVYKFHPHFHDLMVAKISELVDQNYTFNLMLSEDGSGRGAALVAAVATKQEHRRKVSLEQMGLYVPPRDGVNRKNSRLELDELVAKINRTNINIT